MITFSSLKLVWNIVNSGTLTKAAEKMYLSQSALSHQLKDLEHKLGTKIFLRINKKLQLTKVGTKIYEKAEKILSEIENLEHDVLQLANGKDILVKISTECYTAYQWLPSALKNLQSVNDKIEISIEEKATRNIVEYIKSGKIDIGIVSKKSESFNNIEYLDLFDDQLVMVAHKNNPIASKEMVDLTDFNQQQVYFYDINDEESRVLESFSSNGIVPKKVIKIPLTEAILEMVNADLGITIMANWIVKPYLANRNIKIIPINYKSFTRTWYFVYLVSRKNELSTISGLLKNEIVNWLKTKDVLHID